MNNDTEKKCVKVGCGLTMLGCLAPVWIFIVLFVLALLGVL